MTTITAMSLKWSALQPGDIVDFVAPGFRGAQNELLGAVKFVKSIGLVPRVPKNLYRKNPLFSNTDEARFAILKKALMARDSKAVWCVRGGYGSIRLLNDLNKLKAPPVKVFLGYSDITTLHLFLNQEWGWSSLHSPVLDRFGGGRAKPVEVKETKGLLFGKMKSVEFLNLKPLNKVAQKTQSISGSITGGNLAVLQSSFGTDFELRTKNKILFLEDIGERPHRLDRMLVHLTQTQALKGCKAIVFGDLVLSDGNERQQLWKDVVYRFASGLAIPVMRGLPVGHGPVQRFLPLNTAAVLKTGAKGSLFVEAGT